MIVATWTRTPNVKHCRLCCKNCLTHGKKGYFICILFVLFVLHSLAFAQHPSAPHTGQAVSRVPFEHPLLEYSEDLRYSRMIKAPQDKICHSISPRYACSLPQLLASVCVCSYEETQRCAFAFTQEFFRDGVVQSSSPRDSCLPSLPSPHYGWWFFLIGHRLQTCMISPVGDVNCFHVFYVLLLLLSDVSPLTDNQTLNVNQGKWKNITSFRV